MKLVDRKTGAIVDVPDDQAQAAFMSGQYGVPKGAPMPIKTQMGIAGRVAPEDAGLALERHGTVPTEAEYRQAENERKYGGVGGGVAAGAVGAARGAASAFGVPLDAAATSFAGTLAGGHDEIDPYKGQRHISREDELRDALRGLDEAHPLASAGGELAGFAGASLLGPGAVGRVGAAGEALGGMAGRFAAEGGAIGGVGAINEAALGDERVTAGKIMAAVGHGALVGGALGGAAHLGAEAAAGARDKFGRWLATVKPESIDALARSHFGYAPEGLGETVQKGYAKVSSAMSGKDADTIARFTELSPEGAEARRVAVFDSDKITEEAERAVRKHIDNLTRAGDLVSAEARGGLKADYVKHAVARGNEEQVQTFAQKKLGSLIEGADAQLGQEMAPTMTKAVESVSKLAYRAQEAAAAGDNAAAFIALDDAKRGIQRLTSNGYKSLHLIADPVDQMNARRVVTWLDGAASDLRASLEDETMWGKAAIDQREINAAWTKQIDASNRFHRALTTEVGRDPANPYLQIRGADPAKVSSYVRGLTNPNNDLTHQAVKSYVASTRELADAIGKSYELPAEKVAEVARVKDAAQSFGNTVDKAEKTLVTANQYRELMGAPEGGTVAGALGMIGSVVGGAPGGALGSLASAAIGAAKDPHKVIAQMAALERLAGKVDGEIVGGVKRFLSGGKVSAEQPASVAMLGGAKTERGAFEAKVNEVRRLAGNKEELVARIRQFTDQFSDVAPGVAKALTFAAVKGLEYLSATAPPGFQPRPEALAWGLDEPPLYTDAEMREWSRRAAVVHDPMTAVKSMQRKMLTPEEADALKQVHPPIFQALQREFMVQRSDPKRTPMTYGQQLQIELMFDVPLNRSLDPAFMRAVQATFASPEPRKPHTPTIGPSRIAKSQASTADAIRGGY